MDRKDFQSLARTRLAEAKALLDKGMSEGAYYLAGYAVECALKACIAKRTKRYDFPDKKRAEDAYNHDLGKLFRAAQLDETFARARQDDPALEENWKIIKEWSEQSRYNLPERRTEEEARLLIRAIVDKTHGVLRWLRNHW